MLATLLGACSEASRLEPPVTRVESLPLAAFPGREGAARGTPVLKVLDTHETGLFNRGAAEVVDYHAASRRVFVINSVAGQVTVVELGPRGFRRGERALEPRRDIRDFSSGRVTSLAVSGDLVAVAVCAASNDRRGRVAFYSAAALRFLGALTVGYVPDMLTFTPDGRRLLVANEGEQVRSAEDLIVADPEGSVSIIDVSGGIARASVTHVGFAAFDGRIEAYRNAGVRIPRLGDSFFEAGEGEVRLSTDLEPEYIAVAPDGRTAWVSLQENDAVAVLDVEARAFTDILPLGVKDFSRGLPAVQPVALPPPERAGAPAHAPVEPSGLWFEPREGGDGRAVFYLLQGASIVRRELEGGRASAASEAVSIRALADGRVARGLARDADDGSFWVGDSRGAVVYRVTRDGRFARRLLLGGSAADEARADAGVLHRARSSARRPARHTAARPRGPGVVALALDAELERLYVVLQAPASAEEDGGGRIARILAVEADTASPRFGALLGEYLYLPSQRGSAPAARVAGAAIESSGRLLVLEQGEGEGAAPAIFRADLAGATDVLGAGRVAATALDARGADDLTRTYGVAPVHKRRILSLPGYGRALDGNLAVLDGGRFAIAAVGAWSPLGERARPPGPAVTAAGAILEVVSFDEQNRLDVSDRDGRVALRHWPVFGGYMPDGIEALRVDGRDYFVTANEGDTRRYDAKRLADVELDRERFPEAAALQSSAALGRLKISPLDGDLDGDGDVDEIHSFGARSLSVWDSSGNLIFDTGSLLEDVTALAQAGSFNSNNDSNGSFDTRSDNRGPEPEGLEVGEIDGRLYVFVGLERVGGILVLDLTDPRRASFVEYVNPRNFGGDAERGKARDLGPEGLKFVPARESPTGRGLLLVANEVSGTTTAFDVNL